jgi:hypothetical protein
LVETANATANPNLILTHLTPDAELSTGHPATGKFLVDGRPTAYVCHGQTCGLPHTDPAGLKKELSS